MMFDEQLKLLREQLEKSARGTFWEHLGMQVETFSEQEICVSLDILPHHLNGIGILNGGVHASILDNTMGLASIVASPANKVVTTQLHVHYLTPIQLEKISVRAQIIHQSKSMITTEGRLTGADGRLCAYGTASFRVLHS
jgi:uncharacterized protein (TIGR00369 family)